MDKTNQNHNTWRMLHNIFMRKAAEAKPKFLPSGRLKATEKLDYREVIETASRSMIRFKKPERLIRMIVRIIAEQVMVTHTGILLYNKKKKDSYILIDSKGEQGKKMPIGYIRIPSHSPLINIFMERRTSLLDERGVLIYENLHKGGDGFVKGHRLHSSLFQEGITGHISTGQ